MTRQQCRSRRGATQGGLSLANGRVYLSTFDGYQYCFGIKQKQHGQEAARAAR